MVRSAPSFGAHMSIAGGLENAFAAGARVGCECLQIFVKNQRQWHAPPLTDGQGTNIGYRFEQLASICDRVAELERLGVCLDTCHLFAAGYDFRKPEGYAAMIDELDSAIGLSMVKCIHMNDSKHEAGSRVDRHEHIGKGKIGKKAFAHFVNDLRFANVPMILETPKGKDGRGADLDKVNLKRLRSLIAM